jgi:glutamyl-tRNA synthetase
MQQNKLNNKEIRVRFAPSPTGYLHIGGARTALFNWLYAKHNNAAYLMRFEDTDLKRSSKEFLDSQLKSLEWLGLSSEKPIIHQMKRLNEHVEAAKKFLDQGLAYPCFCPPRDADKVVSDLEKGVVNKYPGTCRNNILTKENFEKSHAIRFKLPNKSEDVEFVDLIRGTVKISADQLDDMVIVRRDGSPTYNFCVVIDDIFMNISHVIRGEDHLTNTAKQLLFYRALDTAPPHYAHLPLILSPKGGKLSKRDTVVSVEEYRKNGFIAEALINYLSRLGWAHGDQEIFSIQELIDSFTLEAVGKKGAVFDIQKLTWLNGTHIRKSTFEQLMIAIEQMDQSKHEQLLSTWSSDQLKKLIEQYKERTTTLLELCNEILELAKEPENIDTSLIAKWHTEKTKLAISMFAQELEKLTKLEKEMLLESAKQAGKQHGEKLVTIAQPLRLALTGKIKSPGVFELIEIIGKEKALARIYVLLARL